MKPSVAPCGLCLEEKPLLDSHLLPAALYRLALQPQRAENLR
jgi:hypothetical protein